MGVRSDPADLEANQVGPTRKGQFCKPLMSSEVVQRHCRLLKSLCSMHAGVTKVKGYTEFLLQYIPLQALTVSSNLALLVLVRMFRDDFEQAVFGDGTGSDGTTGKLSKLSSAGSNIKLTDTLKIVIPVFAVLQIAGRLAPLPANCLLESLRGGLQVEQATQVVAKVFELPHDSMISTPTGEFAQLIGKIFMVSMGGVPMLYKSVFPIAAEFAISTAFIGLIYGWPAALQAALFMAHTAVTYAMAGWQADSQKQSMKALMGEWGKIMGVAANHEMALYYGQVKREVATARVSFEVIQGAMSKMVGIDWPSFFQRCITMVASMAFVALVFSELKTTTVLAGADEVTLLERLALCMYFLFNFAILQMQAWAAAIVALRRAVAEFEVVQQFFERTSETADAEGATDIGASGVAPPSISFEGVSFSYKDKVILDNVSFAVGPGETLGLAGASGSGKSTILRLLLRLYKPTAGVIRVNGRDINSQAAGRAVTGQSLRRLVSVVAQNPKLFNGSIRDNISYGAGEDRCGSVPDSEILRVAQLAGLDLAAIADESEEAALLVDAEERERRALLALEKSCGEGGAKLSGGQQQRVAIARALLKDGPVFVLDEPTTGLDNVVAQRLQETLEGLVPMAGEIGGHANKRSKTTIMVTHHLQDLRRASHILYLEEGKIVEEGAFDALVGAGGVFAGQVAAGLASNAGSSDAARVPSPSGRAGDQPRGGAVAPHKASSGSCLRGPSGCLASAVSAVSAVGPGSVTVHVSSKR